ncbi:MAG: glycine--tRNA ligase subunit beta [gamma proteobacterium symbiont of Bathyaustriella thionipta]|nr:glycine--tRNA ligase subunit beta [gamma proteobacterium symbiont of Bathyaustriella thionipta]
MADQHTLLFEIGTEELPPGALAKLAQALLQGFRKGLDDAGLGYTLNEWYATPRRLAMYFTELDARQADRNQERRGPAVQVAFDQDGNATPAAQGFARSCGVDVSDLQRLTTDKGEWLVYTQHEAGKTAMQLLPDIAAKALAGLPIPKRMRWGAGSAEFVRPVHWLLFMLDKKVVDCRLLDTQAANLSYGHRFHAPAAIRIKKPEDYLSLLLKKGKVMARYNERREYIRQQVEAQAEAVGGTAPIDEALLEEVTSLVEWPVAISGSFEKTFLQVPHEALIMSMKKNQKYFHLVDARQRLLPYFITIANIDSSDPDVISRGNERVIRPRLADARFFWNQDCRKKLQDFLPSLASVVFQQKLGSLCDKTDRLTGLALEIGLRLNADSELLERAALLSRCDLMSEMVNEFPGMQGIMGRYMAQHDNEPAEVAQAMDEFYMPRFSGDRIPQTSSGRIIALADRLDTLVGIFGIGQKPTGVKDPFGLRRASISVLRILLEGQLDVDLYDLLQLAAEGLHDRIQEGDTVDTVYAYIRERQKGIYLEQGFKIQQFEAVAAVDPRKPLDFDRRMHAVQHFHSLDEAAALASANKRIANLLKKSAQGSSMVAVDESLFDSEQESRLFQQICTLRPKVEEHLQQQNYQQAMVELAILKPGVDDFFDHVMVMVDEEAIRENRLALLREMNSLFLKVADIACLEA